MSYTLYNADCLDVFGTLDAGSVDAIICDPPYGTTACKWDSVIPFAPMWAGIKRVLKPRGACVLFGNEPFSSFLRVSNINWYRHERIWNKGSSQNFVRCKREPLKEHENIIVFSDGDGTYNPQMIQGSPYRNYRIAAPSLIRMQKSGGATKANTTINSGVRYPNAHITIRRLDRNRVHPTQKPLALLEYLVKTYTNEGDLVLDFTMGSGTTGHACGNLDRRFIGIEKDAAYFAIAQERIATAYEPLRMMQVAV